MHIIPYGLTDKILTKTRSSSFAQG